MSKQRNLVWSYVQAVNDSDLPMVTKHMLLVISTYMNSYGGGCWPSVKTIAQKMSCTTRLVYKHLNIAEKEGFILRGKRGLKGRRKDQNEYRAAIPGYNHTYESITRQEKRGMNDVHPSDDTEMEDFQLTGSNECEQFTQQSEEDDKNMTVEAKESDLRDEPRSPHEAVRGEQGSSLRGEPRSPELSKLELSIPKTNFGVRKKLSKPSQKNNKQENQEKTKKEGRDRHAFDQLMFATYELMAGRRKTPEEKRTWLDGFYRQLQDYPLAVVKQAVEQWQIEQRWLPVPSDIVKIIQELGRADQPEADVPCKPTGNGVWDQVRQGLLDRLGQAVFRNWIDRLHFVGLQGGNTLLLAADSRFVREHVQTHYTDTIFQAYKKVNPRAKTLDIRVMRQENNQKAVG